ncbi:MAG: ABC transporter substrate-binding protein [Lachnospiraceae bacterium]
MKNDSNEKHKRVKFLVFLAALVLVLGIVIGCENNTVQEKKDNRYIAVICKGSQHEFWKTVEQGAMDAGEELGIDVTFEAPEDESQIDVQISMVEKAIENNADAIVLAPLDTDLLNDVIEKAANKGIPVLTFDSDVTTDARVATIGTDNESAGAIAARNAASLMGDSGEVAVIAHVEGAQTAIARNNGFVEELQDKYKDDIKVVGLKYCNGDPEIAKEQAKQFIKDYPDIKCIYGTNEGCAVGIAAAVDELNMKDKIVVIGFDSSDTEISYLEDGVLDGMMVQNPYNMGYLGVRNINKVLDGKQIEEKIDTGATYVNSENLYDEDTQWLLYPLGRGEE